jgi:hypothetical protein
LAKSTEEELDLLADSGRLFKKGHDCRLSLRESSESCEMVFRSAKAHNHVPITLTFYVSRKRRNFRGAKGDNEISLTIDEDQNSIRGGTKQAKKISDSRHILGGANVSAYWIYVYDAKCAEKYFRSRKRGARKLGDLD